MKWWITWKSWIIKYCWLQIRTFELVLSWLGRSFFTNKWVTTSLRLIPYYDSNIYILILVFYFGSVTPFFECNPFSNNNIDITILLWACSNNKALMFWACTNNNNNNKAQKVNNSLHNAVKYNDQIRVWIYSASMKLKWWWLIIASIFLIEMIYIIQTKLKHLN